jgi:hypothetical protein
MTRYSRSDTLVLLLLAAVASTWTAPIQATQRPAVIELYTSEGCSSCPPADALLGALAGEPGVLALAFHVDYWDSLGWTDKFALPVSAQRQSRYAQTLGLASIFTPQVIVDGKASLVGSNRDAISQAIAKSRDGVAITISRQGDNLAIKLESTTIRPPADVQLVAYLPRAVTAIGRGENAGRTLQEVNIVRAIYTLGTWDGHLRTFTVASSSLASGATRVAVLIQEPGQRAILGAASYTLR